MITGMVHHIENPVIICSRHRLSSPVLYVQTWGSKKHWTPLTFFAWTKNIAIISKCLLLWFNEERKLVGNTDKAE